jgi:DNA-binding NarL/FixJ family response regulator
VKGSSVSVLIVDDFGTWRSVVRATLRSKLGIRMIEEAEHGLEAVQKSSERRRDLVVLDMGLPGLNGLEVARQIKRISPESKIVFLSENASRDLIEAALNAGGSGYVIKSAFAREFIPAVKAVLGAGQLGTAELNTLTLRPEWV